MTTTCVGRRASDFKLPSIRAGDATERIVRLRDLVRAMLALDPAERPSMADVLSQLR